MCEDLSSLEKDSWVLFSETRKDIRLARLASPPLPDLSPKTSKTELSSLTIQMWPGFGVNATLRPIRSQKSRVKVFTLGRAGTVRDAHVTSVRSLPTSVGGKKDRKRRRV